MVHESRTEAVRRPLDAVFRFLAAICGIGVLIGSVARVWLLGFPNETVFDEVYFPAFAWKFLHGEQAFDVHPPLGKFLLAIPEWLLGNTEIAWRLMPSLFGVGLLVLLFFLWRKFQPQDLVGALVLPFLFALDGIFIVYSRIGLMDGILVFFILTVFYLGLRVKTLKGLLVLAVAMGLAVAIKWIALGVLPALAWVLWRRGLLKQALFFLPVAVAVYVAVVLLGEWIAHTPHMWAAFKEWHKQAYRYHRDLKATHPWSSSWWTWPLMLRPVLLYYKANAAGDIQMITALGNPAIWWASTLAVLGSLVTVLHEMLWGDRKKLLDHPLIPLLLGYFMFLLPWLGIHRVLFIYHYLPSYAFALLMLTYWIGYGWQQGWREAVISYVGIAFIAGIFYLPLATGWPLSKSWLQSHFLINDKTFHIIPAVKARPEVYPDLKGWL